MRYGKLNPLQFTGIEIDKQLSNATNKNVAFLLAVPLNVSMPYACVECFQKKLKRSPR